MLHVKSGGVVTIHTEQLHDGDPANPLDSSDLGGPGTLTLDLLIWRWSGSAKEFYDWNDSTFKALGSVTTLRYDFQDTDWSDVMQLKYFHPRNPNPI